MHDYVLTQVCHTQEKVPRPQTLKQTVAAAALRDHLKRMSVCAVFALEHMEMETSCACCRASTSSMFPALTNGLRCVPACFSFGLVIF
jgi:hypothetical protein